MPTVTAANNQQQVVIPSPFIVEMYKTGNARSILDALGTMMTVGKHAVIQPGELPNIDDCYFRMLTPHEIKLAMAFPEDYVITGNQRDQIRQAGNAVTAPVMRMLIERGLEALAG